MGCKHSKPQEDKQRQHEELSIPVILEAKTKETIEGIECSTAESEATGIQAEETPHDIRKIRDELFSKDSLLAIASSCKANLSKPTTTDLTHENSLSSYGSSHQSYYLDEASTSNSSGSSCNGEGDNKDGIVDNSNNSNTDFGTNQELSCNHRNKTSNSGSNSYHYPAALYEEIKSVKHFVPTTTSNAYQKQRSNFPSLRSICSDQQSEESSDEDEEGTSSVVSSPGGTAFGGDFDFGRSFPQFEALVDTMALSLEPQNNHESDDYNNLKPALSFGALLDMVAVAEEGEDTYQAIDLGGEEFFDDGQFSSCTGAMTKKSGRVAPSKSKARVPKSRNYRRQSAPPMLEQKHSSELLADIKALALLADIQSRQMSTNKNTSEVDSEDKTDMMIYCTGHHPTKYHRSDSVVPASSDNISVCSDLGRWMK